MEAEGPGKSEDDATLLLRIRNGDSTAWELLVTRHKTWIYRMAYRINRNEDDAYDATQETFMKIATNLPRFRDQDKFQSWATSIAVREAVNIHRKKSRIPEPVDPAIITTTLETRQLHTGELIQVERVAKRQQLEQLDAAAGELSAQQRAIIILGIANNLTPAEVAERLDLPANQVRSQWSRGLAKLKSILNPDKHKGDNDERSAKA